MSATSGAPCDRRHLRRPGPLSYTSLVWNSSSLPPHIETRTWPVLVGQRRAYKLTKHIGVLARQGGQCHSTPRSSTHTVPQAHFPFTL